MWFRPQRPATCGAARIAVANAKLQSSAVAIARFFSTVAGAPSIEVLGDLVYRDMADKIRDTGAQLDLSSSSVVESVVEGIAFETGLMPSEENLAAAVSSIVAANEKLDSLDPLAADLLEQRAKIEIVAIGQLAPAWPLCHQATLPLRTW